MFTIAFWKAAFERAIKTGAQANILAWGLGDKIAGRLDIDWADVPVVFAGGMFISAMFSLASIPLSAGNSPSLVPQAEIDAAQA